MHNYWSEYEKRGGDVFDFLTRKRKIDNAVVEAAGDVVGENPTASTSDTTNPIERFFRAYQRFYKTRG